MRSTTRSPLMTTSVGMLLAPKPWARRGFSSTLTLTTLMRPAYSLASAASIGPTTRQGPHHGAQRSTRTATEARASTRTSRRWRPRATAARCRRSRSVARPARSDGSCSSCRRRRRRAWKRGRRARHQPGGAAVRASGAPAGPPGAVEPALPAASWSVMAAASLRQARTSCAAARRDQSPPCIW